MWARHGAASANGRPSTSPVSCPASTRRMTPRRFRVANSGSPTVLSSGYGPRRSRHSSANYETLMPNVIRQIRLVRFYFAPLDGDAHLYDRVEGAIGRYYKVHRDSVLRDFFGPGIKLPAAIPGDKPIRLVLSSESLIAGLPPEILT